MKRKRLLTFPLFLTAALLLTATPAWAGSTTRIALINIPGNPLTSFDISWVDDDTYYLADRSNAGIDIIDAEDNIFLTRIGGFVGFHIDNDHSGPNGILVIHDRDELWAGDGVDGDGHSTVKVVDLEAGAISDSIVIPNGTARADELAFDPEDRVLIVANDADEPPFVTFISTEDHSILGQLEFPNATDGLEQPVWVQAAHRFYLAVPETRAHPGGEIDVIDPVAMVVTDVFPVTECNPHGLALGPHHQLLVGCSGSAIRKGAHAKSVVMDARSGAIVATITQVGGSDEVWFNPGDHRYYLAANNMTSDGTRNGTLTPVLGIIDARTNTWIENVPTVRGAHSVAADRENNHIFVPLSGLGIGVYARGGDDDQD